MADNSSRRFKFISPGVFVDEIDNSQLPATPDELGPVIIGRARRGPGNVPVQIDSFSDFVETFGDPVAGNDATDVWRQGNTTAPTYAAYAAKAWLRNNSPITFLRVLGDQSSTATTGQAGWKLDDTQGIALDQGGTYALVLWPSGAVGSVYDGVVAAQFYCQDSRVLLSGSIRGGGANVARGSTMISVPDLDSIKLRFTGSSITKEATVSIQPSKANFIREALNTNPTITNSAITKPATQTYFQGGQYFLGESFERRCLSGGLGLLESSNDYYGAMIPMVTKTAPTTFTNDQADFQGGAKTASTGWFIAQDLSNDFAAYDPKDMQQLFRCEALTAGEGFQRDIKISIANIKAPAGDFADFGTFSILIRRVSDTDANPQIIERFDLLNINPASPNYVARVIGDRYSVYDQTTKRMVEYGDFANSSNYIRIVMDEDVGSGTGERGWLPFGVWGPLKYRSVGVVSGSSAWSSSTSTPISGTTAVQTLIAGGASASFGLDGFDGGGHPDLILDTGDVTFSGSIEFPGVPLRVSSSQGSPKSLRNTFWGSWTGRTDTDTFYDLGLPDYLRARTFDLTAAPYSTTHDVAQGTQANATTDPLQTSWVFSLDDVSGSVVSSQIAGVSEYAYNNRRSGESLTAKAGEDYKSVLKMGIDRFTTVLAGGTDGYDITEREPFNARSISDSDTEDTSYTLYSLRKAVNTISDPDYVQMNAVSIPGVISPEVTNYLLDTAEERADCLAIIDIQNAYTPDTENSASAEARNVGNTPAAAVTALQARSINNSYGATYYPWIRITDTQANQTLWAPPSVAAMGVLSTTDRLQAPWFAPAGFTRGGLSEGAAGIPVVEVSRRLTSDERDNLYEANINPIAKFPAEGIVIFGQKTLQQTASALDRINVRRLMIFLKREISFIASRLLFAPNTQLTWDRFLGQATPVLEGVKADFGVEDFKLILDDSTTTPDLIDRNIIYAKLFVKPTRAAEFFAIDFVVTNSGAAFED
jgi:hypothetical protein